MALQTRIFAAKRIRRLSGRAPAAARDETGDLQTHAGTLPALDAYPAELFDRDGLRRTLQAALDGSGRAVPLFVLLTLGECARLFGPDGPTDPPTETHPPL